MKASVYIGDSKVETREVPIPQIANDEILLKVELCGLCGADVIKIRKNLLSPLRVFGHEIVGTIAKVGKNVPQYKEGDRVVVFHHVPCLNCDYCQRKNFVFCKTYQKIDTTSGIGIPSGGGFGEFIRIPSLVVSRGLIKIPDDIPFEMALFTEPTCCYLKAINTVSIDRNAHVLIVGYGTGGMLISQLIKRYTQHIIISEKLPHRAISSHIKDCFKFFNANDKDIIGQIKIETPGKYGVDVCFVSVNCSSAVDQAIRAMRKGGTVILTFAHSNNNTFKLNMDDISVREISIVGSYSSSPELNYKASQIIFRNKITLPQITHTFSLDRVQEAIELFSSHDDVKNANRGKIVIRP